MLVFAADEYKRRRKEKGETCFKFHWDLNLHLLAQMSSANQLTMVLPGKWGHSYITLPLPYRANHLLQHYCVNWREVLHILQLHRTFVPRNPHSYFHLNRFTGPQAEPQIIHGADMDTQTETSFFVRQTLFITITVLCKSQNLVCRSYSKRPHARAHTQAPVHMSILTTQSSLKRLLPMLSSQSPFCWPCEWRCPSWSAGWRRYCWWPAGQLPPDAPATRAGSPRQTSPPCGPGPAGQSPETWAPPCTASSWGLKAKHC